MVDAREPRGAGTRVAKEYDGNGFWETEDCICSWCPRPSGNRCRAVRMAGPAVTPYAGPSATWQPKNHLPESSGWHFRGGARRMRMAGSFLPAHPCQEQQSETDYDAHSGQPIAPARVDRLIAAKRVRSIQLSADIRGQAGDDAPVRI